MSQETEKVFDLIVIGAGSAGLSAVEFARKLGVTVALVEKERVGGDCTWTGCVPSKALLQAAKIAHAARTAAAYGVTVAPPQTDMKRVKAYVQQTIADIYRHETPEQLEKMGVHVIQGAARFLDSRRIQVGERIVQGRAFVLATGAVPHIPSMTGLASVPYDTYLTLFENERLPTHLLAIGAGPVGIETAQAYGRLGARVTLVDVGVLPQEDRDAAACVQRVLAQEGVAFEPGWATAVSYEDGQFQLSVAQEKESHPQKTLSGDMLLAATGRNPNVEELNLDAAGVVYSDKGIEVDEYLATRASHIYAGGDCLGWEQFTHYAGWQGVMAARNALLPGKNKGVAAILPRVVFTDPELAHVGLTAAEAMEKHGQEVQVLRRDLNRIDRAVTDGATSGFIKLVSRGNGRILGATIVAPRAGEMIAEISLAMTQGISISDLANTIHPYPTYAMGLQRLSATKSTQDFVQSRLGRLLIRLRELF